MSVGIVGAGIAGLALAARLGGEGRPCTVYERAAYLGEVGAGIQLAPNAVRLLRRIGEEVAVGLDAVAVRPDAIEFRRWRGGELIARTELGAACERMYGAPYLTVHRGDLHRLLVAAALRHGADIRLGHRLVGLVSRPSRVDLWFADGSVRTDSLVVGADGIRSVVRSVLVRDEPRYSGVCVYRALVAADRLPAELCRPRVTIWLGPGQHCVWYPVAGGRWYSVVAAIQDPAGGRESWRAPGHVEDVVAAYDGWHPSVTTMLAAAGSVSRWALHDRPPLARWYTDRITVVGDAAHPMLPLGAQGANQAIESAFALASCLARSVDLESALRRYAEVRAPRLARVMAAVRRNVADHHLDDGPGQHERDRDLADRTDLLRQAWLFSHDAEAAANDAVYSAAE